MLKWDPFGNKSFIDFQGSSQVDNMFLLTFIFVTLVFIQ